MFNKKKFPSRMQSPMNKGSTEIRKGKNKTISYNQLESYGLRNYNRPFQ